jgi:hypothetical protein
MCITNHWESFQMVPNNAQLQTVKSLRLFCVLYEQIVKQKPTNISHLTTLMVENFFSMVRAKIRYPNLWQYACVYHSAYNELVKRLLNFKDRGYSLKDSNVGKKYVLVEGMQLDSSLLKTIKPSKKKAESKKVTANPLNDQCREKILELLSKYRCGQKLFTIRELTCKSVPTWCQNAAFLCPMEDCPDIYFYQKSFKTHLSTTHKLPTTTLDEMCKKAHLISGHMWKTSQEEEEDDLMLFQRIEEHVDGEVETIL